MTNWWQPDRSGVDAIDTAIGAICFGAAVQFARHCGGTGDVLCRVITAMRNGGCGSCEMGFIDALARKATVGTMPPAISDVDVAGSIQMSAGALTVEGVRHGEQEARECLNLARQLKWPELIATDLQAVIERRYTGNPAGFVWAVCGAAMAGGSN